MWPHYPRVFVRRLAEWESGDGPEYTGWPNSCSAPAMPALTLEESVGLRARYQVSPERLPCAYDGRAVKRDMNLLLTVQRLRGMLRRAYEVREHFPKPNTCRDEIWQEFQGGLANEPAVMERQAS
jgi:hypothetical protein